ncbi:MAG TPA: ABC transporter permease [Blastocatellia bacterium]|nr:ABC transporter permease [Blastocatellia bacterium]
MAIRRTGGTRKPRPLRRIIAQTRKELTQIVRDWRTLTLALVLPLVLLILNGSAISLTASDLPIIVQDFDDSTVSRDFIDAFRASITFHVAPWPTDKQPEYAFTSGAAHAALIIPPHFGRDMARGVGPQVQMLVDASDANTAKLVAGYSGQITRAYNRLNAGTQFQPVQSAIRLWYNPDRSSKKFYGPGIFVLGISMFPPLLAALAMAKEGEQQTILQVYVSNVSAGEFLLGKIIAFVLVALAECVLGLLLLFTYFEVSLAGDPTPFVVATILYAFCVASFGTMIGAAIPHQAAAMQAVALGGFLLVFLLSGLLFPIENIPAGLRWLSRFVWGRYYIEIVRDALLQGGGWPAVWYKVLIIGLIGSIFYALAWSSMRRMELKN